jgi:glycosyltransferase involved in cell wall biosynthesis
LDPIRCVIDLQGAQSESRYRGIGRYSLDLTHAMARKASGQELWIVLNGLLPDSVEYVRAFFDGLIPQERIVVFTVPGPVSFNSVANDWRIRTAERLRESFIADLKPDVVLISSLIEGFSDNVVTSINTLPAVAPTAAILYDLIPLLRPDSYLCDPRVKTWYLRKIQALKAADVLLAISGSSRREAMDHLNRTDDQIIIVSCGVHPRFKPICSALPIGTSILRPHGITRPFVMYSGAVDPRKNVEGLISAFALLPSETRRSYQLAIVGKYRSDQQSALIAHLHKVGLNEDEVIFTGYVSDEDLVALYSLCALFVLPSFHEGFGLPALEAMACGAPTIGANATSIPEVLGRTDALFDPHQPTSIADKLYQALTDDGFSKSLRDHGLRQVRKFTWESSARRTLEALEEVGLRKRAPDGCSSVQVGHRRLRLAYVSPLPPQKSGISDYSAELLPELARYYEIEVVAHLVEVDDPGIKANFPVRDLLYFSDKSSKYDRILYHFGNSSFHSFMFDLLERKPGTVVLHDFFLSDLLDWMEWRGLRPNGFLTELYASHGYSAVEYEGLEGRKAAVEKYPCNRQVLSMAGGIIVHSKFPRLLAEKWYGVGADEGWHQIPLLRTVCTPNRIDARARLGLTADTFLVCCFGLLTPAKLNDRLITAWLNSDLGHDPACQLVFVGSEGSDANYKAHMDSLIAGSGVSERIRVTGFASRELYKAYLSSADIAVQLRARSRGETSRAVLDCIAHGVPTIVNAHGSSAEFPEKVVAAIPDIFDDCQLAAELERLYTDVDYRHALSASATRHVRTSHHPAHVAALYRDAIEHFAQNHPRLREERLVRTVGSMASPVPPSEADLSATASAMAVQRPQFGPRQLLLDVSGTARDDLKTGIQRVARHIATQTIRNPPSGFQSEPIHDLNGSYTYGRRFSLAMLGRDPFIADDPVEVHSGDVFLGLDICPDGVPLQWRFFQDLRARNVSIYFVVYDLLPILQPDTFPAFLSPLFLRWLETLCEFSDGLVCISRSVADELLNWLEEVQIDRLRPLKIGYFHLGADIIESASTKGLPPNADAVLAAIRERPSVLMVGTIEPRKGHAQALAAIEQLWAEGFQANLVVVGHEGWQVDSLTERMRNHSEKGKRFFWLSTASDEMLALVYSSAAVLLAASKGEGFGLPLIEGARHKVPIIARDIPVFREVATEHAYYFQGDSADSLASALRTWLDLHSRGLAPSSNGLKWLTWQESAHQLMEVVLGGRVYREWLPARSLTQRCESEFVTP